MTKTFSGRKTLILALLVCAVVSMTGCVYVVVGSLGALGGYVVSPDTVEGMVTGRSYAEVWDAVIETISVIGVIQDRNDSGGIVIAKIDGAKTTITALRTTSDSVRLTVKARKAFLPKVRVAQDIYIKIIDYLDQNYIVEVDK